MTNLVSTYLSLHKLVHNRRVVEVQLDFEKNKSSLLTISNVLKEYHLSSNTYYSDIESLQKDKRQAILYLRIDGGRYVILKKINKEGNILFYDPVLDKDIEVSQYAFEKLWSNVVIYSDFVGDMLDKVVPKRTKATQKQKTKMND